MSRRAVRLVTAHELLHLPLWTYGCRQCKLRSLRFSHGYNVCRSKRSVIFRASDCHADSRASAYDHDIYSKDTNSNLHIPNTTNINVVLFLITTSCLLSLASTHSCYPFATPPAALVSRSRVHSPYPLPFVCVCLYKGISLAFKGVEKLESSEFTFLRGLGTKVGSDSSNRLPCPELDQTFVPNLRPTNIESQSLGLGCTCRLGIKSQSKPNHNLMNDEACQSGL